MNKIVIGILALLLTFQGQAQQKTENLIIITLDGMRWQEVFKGADSVIIRDSTFTRDRKELQEKFWSSSLDERRRKLFPFIWNTIGKEGQLYGNRQIGNKVDNSNPYWFSYPGYNEIFTGYPDTAVNSNDKIYNRNENVLEFINRQPAYNGSVAVFATWDVFPYILNQPRSGIYVNADADSIPAINPSLKLLNDMQYLAPRPIGVRPDLLTYFAAREYLKAKQPKVLYIAFDETDDFAHSGMYDQYLGSAHAQDAMIADLWKLVQSMKSYQNKTTLIITCDHGRGDTIKEEWKHHGQKIKDAHEIWIAAIGPDTPADGVVKTNSQLWQAQLASTFARVLGLNFTPAHPHQEPVKSIYTK